jgi:hypothetical protein
MSVDDEGVTRFLNASSRCFMSAGIFDKTGSKAVLSGWYNIPVQNMPDGTKTLSRSGLMTRENFVATDFLK